MRMIFKTTTQDLRTFCTKQSCGLLGMQASASCFSLFPGIIVVIVLVRSSSKVHTHTCRSAPGLSYFHSFGLRVQARGIKAVCVDARRVCRVWAGCRRGQNVCVPRVLQAAR